MSTKAKIIFLILITAVFVGALFTTYSKKPSGQDPSHGTTTWWDIQSIDTMKYSRDVAREKANDRSFDTEIDTQVRLIAETGATYVAIATPYADEFLPFLTRWVDAARKYNLKIWFRGNIPGWEGWFDYQKIGREEHIQMVQDFILANGALFAEGDIFSSCPECENGGPGDPRRTGDTVGHRRFLIDEYRATNEAFRKIGKNVRSNFAPMNGDVANLIMDKDTTQALGGIVVIDHYVGDQQKLAADIKNIAKKSGGKVILGEFGAPIPDLHGDLDAEEQAVWINDAMLALTEVKELTGINYWTGFGGSTRLWEGNFKERPAVRVLTKFFKPSNVSGQITNEIGEAVREAKVSSNSKSTTTDKNGVFSIPVASEQQNLIVQSDGYRELNLPVVKDQKINITLTSESESPLFKLRKVFYNLFRKT